MIVAIDYFTKWVEAETLTWITDKSVWAFILKNIIHRFGVPRIITTDNGRQFESGWIKQRCRELHIHQQFMSVAHPQVNGQVENVNRTIVDGLKKRLVGARGNWVLELPNVLWSYRTTSRAATGETPFNLAYRAEAVVPLETEFSSLRTAQYEPALNDKMMRENVDLLEEVRDRVNIRAARYKERLVGYYNKRVRTRVFLPGDLVLRKMEASDPKGAAGKLAPNWEGPYVIKQALGGGAYKLVRLDRSPVDRTWNIVNLKRYFQ